MKAVIVDFRDGYAAALRDDGCVIKIQDAGYTLGQVIELHEHVRPRWRRTVFSLAAAAALLLSIGGAAYAMPYGTVTLDADSSIQYTINMFDYVLDVQAENEEGEALLAELDIRHIRHRPVDSAITSVMQQLEQRRAPEDAALSVSVSANTRNEKHTERLRRELERTINEHMPIPAPESEPQSGVRDSAEEPQRPEVRPESGPEVYPSNQQVADGKWDGARTVDEENMPQKPQAGQRQSENGASMADIPQEGSPPDNQRRQDKDTGVADVGEEQYPLHTGDSAVALPAPEGNAHKEDTSTLDGQASELSIGSQQPGNIGGGFSSQQSGGFGGGPSMGGGFGGPG